MVERVLHPAPNNGKRESEQHNEFSAIPDSQLHFMMQCIRRELNHRAYARRMEDELSAASRFPVISDAGYFTKRTHSPKEERIPRALRPEHLNNGPSGHSKYLLALAKQDWSYLWPLGDVRRRYCVYAHVDPAQSCLNLPGSFGGATRHPFYIGKGTHERAYDLNRNQGHGIRLKQLIEDGYEKTEIVKVIRDGLTEREALELESKLIYFFGTIYEKGRVGLLLNLDISRRPQFRGTMQILHKIKPSKLKMFSKTETITAISARPQMPESEVA